MANPFKDLKELNRDLDNFLRRHRTVIYNHSKRISDFFEMACYNNIVRFYENNGYVTQIKNLVKQKFRYKCSTAGNPDNFSFFEISKTQGNQIKLYEIRHNLNVQSSFQKDIFTTPDISVIHPNTIMKDEDFYHSNTKYYFVENHSLITFCEAKNFNPFPELLFNFVGIINELKPRLLKPKKANGREHLSASLLISGKSNAHSDRIKKSLEGRYHINILYDLFTIGNASFSKYNIVRLRKLDTLKQIKL